MMAGGGQCSSGPGRRNGAAHPSGPTPPRWRCRQGRRISAPLAFGRSQHQPLSSWAARQRTCTPAVTLRAAQHNGGPCGRTEECCITRQSSRQRLQGRRSPRRSQRLAGEGPGATLPCGAASCSTSTPTPRRSHAARRRQGSQTVPRALAPPTPLPPAASHDRARADGLHAGSDWRPELVALGGAAAAAWRTHIWNRSMSRPGGAPRCSQVRCWPATALRRLAQHHLAVQLVAHCAAVHQGCRAARLPQSARRWHAAAPVPTAPASFLPPAVCPFILGNEFCERLAFYG